MPFSDGDLKRWEFAVKTFSDPKVAEDAGALIARLRASEEKNAYAGHTYHCGMPEDPCECGYDAVDSTWRKAAGK